MTPQANDDSTLVLRARSGDKGAFALLFRRYQPLLRSVCHRYLGHRAVIEDVVQEAALQALLNLGALRQPAHFGSWLAGIGLNLCRRWQRDYRHAPWSWEAVRGGGYRQEPSDWRDGPVDSVLAAELQRRVRDAVATLPPGQRDAVTLFYLSGLTYAETAALLGTPVGAVKTRLHKARTTLRTQLWSVWQEEKMTSEPAAPLRQMRIVDVRTRPVDEAQPTGDSGAYVVLLEEADGGRMLPIWVGRYEGVSLAMLLEKIATPRPLTSVFMAGLLEAAGAQLRQVRITRLENDTYFAEAEIGGPLGRRTVDARPSDALILALTTDAPVYADAAVLERTGVAPGDPTPHLPAFINASAIVAEAQAALARSMEAAEQQRTERQDRPNP